MSNNDTLLGQKLTGPGERDAIHIAVIPVQAAIVLYPGISVGLNAEGKATQYGVEKIGIVDPFITELILKNEWFYLCLYQRTVTGMKHHWQHPAFDSQPQGDIEFNAKAQLDAKKALSEQWLRQFAANAEGIGMSYETLMEAAETFLRTGEDYCFGDDIDYSTNWEEFWHHYSIATGKAVAGTGRDYGFFRCAC